MLFFFFSQHKGSTQISKSKVTVSFYIAAAAAKLLQLCPTLCEPAAHQAPPSLGFFRQEYWSGLLFPSPVRESEK